ncbi:hypothetical protein Bca101_088764 [Brassica carinata]
MHMFLSDCPSYKASGVESGEVIAAELVLEAGHRGRSITLILEDQLKTSQVADIGACGLGRPVKTAATQTDIGGTDHSEVRKLLHDLISAHQRPSTGVTFQSGEARKLWTSRLLERVCGAGSRDYS